MELMIHLFSNLKAALFDLDGTLVETNIDFPLMKREMVALALTYGLRRSDVEPMDILAIVNAIHTHLAESDKNAADNARQRALMILEEIELRHSADAREIPGASELIEALNNRKIKVGIVTRNCRAASEKSLELTGIAADILVCREDVQRTKPAPDQLFYALDGLSASPEHSVMVGDHLMDIAAGKAAGMRTIGVLTIGRPTDFFDPIAPDAVANNIGEILSAVIRCHS